MKEIIVIGDRVLVQLDDTEEKTEVGLYLPQSVKEKDEVAKGRIIKTGPGIPLANPSDLGDEPWNITGAQGMRYMPMEAREGDYALFLRKAVVEINYEKEKYLIVPQSAILLLIRDAEDISGEDLDTPALDFE